MKGAQNNSNITFTDAVQPVSSGDVKPGGAGVNFSTTDGAVNIPLPPNEKPIVTEVSVPSNDTNVIKIIVEIIAPNGTVIYRGESADGTTTLNFDNPQQLPENCTIRVTFVTRENEPAKNVTVSYKACFETSNATTIMTTSQQTDTTTGTIVYTGTTSGAIGATGSETLLIVSSTTTSTVSQGTHAFRITTELRETRSVALHVLVNESNFICSELSS
jgi:hemolysin activation/secretion protein